MIHVIGMTVIVLVAAALAVGYRRRQRRGTDR
jgi:hypothetical protein